MRVVHVCTNMLVHTCAPVTEWIDGCTGRCTNKYTERDAKRQRHTPVTLKVILLTERLDGGNIATEIDNYAKYLNQKSGYGLSCWHTFNPSRPP